MMKYCHRCGKMSEIEGDIKFCPHCGASLEDIQQPENQTGGTPQGPDSAQYQSSESANEKYTPWEDKGKLGFIGSLFETWKESVFELTTVRLTPLTETEPFSTVRCSSVRGLYLKV